MLLGILIYFISLVLTTLNQFIALYAMTMTACICITELALLWMMNKQVGIAEAFGFHIILAIAILFVSQLTIAYRFSDENYSSQSRIRESISSRGCSILNNGILTILCGILIMTNENEFLKRIGFCLATTTFIAIIYTLVIYVAFL